MEKKLLSALVDERFQACEYIDNLKDAFSALDDLRPEAIREYIGRQLYLSGTNHRVVQDVRLTELLFLEADEYLSKALSNLCIACDTLRQGYLSWGEVTTYCASFFAVHGLLRLQGKALGTDYLVFPEFIRSPASIVQHNYVVAKPVKNDKIHEDVWRKFHDTYSGNTEISQREYGDVGFFADVQDLVLEVERRNRFNYRIFDAYLEVSDWSELSRRELFDLPSLTPDVFTNLAYYLGDSVRRYVAKAALRIRLLHDLLYDISGRSPAVQSHFLSKHELRLGFLDAVLDPASTFDRTLIQGGCLMVS